MNVKKVLAGALMLMSLLSVWGCGGGGGNEALLLTTGGGTSGGGTSDGGTSDGGTSSQQVTVPNLVNQTQSAAQSAITSAGLHVGAITPQNSTTVASGTVMSQNPAAGTSVPSGTVVTMIVSAGPPAVGGLPLPVLTPLPASETTPPSGGLTTTVKASYVVLAWNDLGMHCLNPSYDTAVILPPYNNVRAQVIMRGNKPVVVTSGVTVSYRIINNTTSQKRLFTQFWTYALQLFGVAPKTDFGLNLDDPVSNSLTGDMLPKAGYFIASGIPVTPVNDGGGWTPYQMIEVTVKDSTTKAVLAQTRTTIPTSDEINCGKCHPKTTSSDPTVVFQDILAKHDATQGTSLYNDAVVNKKPVLCASCHGSPALNMPTKLPAHTYLSQAIHGFHADPKKVPNTPSCYDCHPGSVTQCNRSTHHTAADGDCTHCHGSLATVASSIATGGRVPWVSEPKCATCHAGVAQVDTGTTLYRNSDIGHGNIFCAACHGSPHAMTPSGQITDNYQSIQYQGKAMAMGDCRVCHNTSRGGGSASEFSKEHGGGRNSACNVCHTGFQNASDTTKWPHQFQWKSR